MALALPSFMRPLLTLLVPFALTIGCSGTFVVAGNDGGSDDGGSNDGTPNGDSPHGDASPDSPEPPPFLCGGQPCMANMYCVTSAMQGCPQCVGSADAGVCPPGSHLGSCGGPVFPDGGDQCVVDPAPPGPPFCSFTIPADCFNPIYMGQYVTCGPSVCAQ